MPIYEYQCEQCGHQVAKLQKLSDVPLTDCPACLAPALGKVLSVPSLRVTGVGGCATDFRVGQQHHMTPCEAGGGCQGCPASK